MELPFFYMYIASTSGQIMVMNYVYFVTDFFDFFHMMTCEDNQFFLSFCLFNDSEYITNALFIQSIGWFIQ